jgi:anaerobic selenocysteine-containing dehydrogenase
MRKPTVPSRREFLAHSVAAAVAAGALVVVSVVFNGLSVHRP